MVEKVDWEKIVERLILWQWLMAAVAVTMGLGLFLIFGQILPPALPMFYSLPWGEEQLADPRSVFIPLGMVVVLAFFSSGVIAKIKKDPVLPAIISGAGLTAEIIIVMAILRVIALVI